MKFLWTCLLILSTSYADSIDQKLFHLYQKGSYQAACDLGYKSFSDKKKDEAFTTLIGFSCLKADQIDRLGLISGALSQSSSARTNAAYFSLLLMQKRLLMQALYDNQIILHVKFPTSAHLLSKVFSLYLSDPQNSSPIKEYIDNANPRQTYRLYTTQSEGRNTIAIDEYYDRILTVHHVY